MSRYCAIWVIIFNFNFWKSSERMSGFFRIVLCISQTNPTQINYYYDCAGLAISDLFIGNRSKTNYIMNVCNVSTLNSMFPFFPLPLQWPFMFVKHIKKYQKRENAKGGVLKCFYGFTFFRHKNIFSSKKIFVLYENIYLCYGVVFKMKNHHNLLSIGNFLR